MAGSLLEQIAEYLRQHPGAKASGIAAALQADRSEINRVLYREKGHRFSLDAAFAWRLLTDDNRKAGGPAQGKPRGNLSRLCQYYRACLAREADRELAAFAHNKYGPPDYAELAAVPAVSDRPEGGWTAPNSKHLMAKLRADRAGLSLYVGFPVRLNLIHARSGWTGFMVEPLLLWEYRLEAGNVEPVGDAPDVNVRALKSLAGVGGQEVLDEWRQLRLDLGIGDVPLPPEDLADAVSALSEVRPGWEWREPLNARACLSTPAIGDLSEPGLYNRAIAMLGERPKYTIGLDGELDAMANSAGDRIAGTALGDWMAGPLLQDDPSPSDDALLEVVPLNSEQREAVRAAMRRKLTVVSGPPGTGKSQVVTSIVVNCAWKGQRVLIASKINKAVDVVEARVNGITSRPTLIRLGARHYQSQLAEHLGSLLSAIATSEDKCLYEQQLSQYRDLSGQRRAVVESLGELVRLRNRVDRAERGVADARAAFGEHLFQRVGAIDTLEWEKALAPARDHVIAAKRASQPFFTRLFWRWLRDNRLASVSDAIGRIAPLATSLGLSMTTGSLRESQIADVESQLAQCGQRLRMAAGVRGYFDLLSQLAKSESPESLARRSLEIEAALAALGGELFESWAKLITLRIKPEHRAALADSKALLEMVAGAPADGDGADYKLRGRLHALLPKIADLLPAWAVANLSARGRLPLEPGYFDLLVVDESSQCDIASILPLLYRSKRVVIIGDGKQLAHISKIPRQVDNQLFVQHDLHVLGERWAYVPNSALDLASALIGPNGRITLRDHHRSHGDIIGYSNRQFYDGSLRIATRYNSLRMPSSGGPAVRWVEVRGTVRRPQTGGAVNESEALAVVSELRRLLVDQRYPGSVGVVSPFASQKKRISDLIHQDDALLAVFEQRDGIVDTAYGFQGDERDAMLFSPVVSKDTPPTALGFLRDKPNQFNVAVTRARAALIVVGDRNACATSDIPHLEAFAKYKPESRDGPRADRSPVGDLGPQYPPVSNPERVSEWEKFFYGELYKAGLRPIPQYPEEQYVLDFALLVGEQRLNVEIDGERYHRDWDGELAYRDQIRNRRLIELGWDVMRFWVYQVRDDTEACVQRVREWTKK